MMLKELSFRMYKSYLLQTCIVILYASFVIGIETPMLPNMDLDKIRFKGKPVAPCIACRKMVQSFLTAVNETTRQSFAGGDADWEKQKLGNYENSELRFIEIQEMLCADVGLGKDQCYNLAEQHESELEDWFYEKRFGKVDLYKMLCINQLKVCCPNNTYGPNCIPCPGGIEIPCGGHGKCMKGGTREEPATCFCDAGYIGELCDTCDRGYYQELDVSTLSCKICDKACRSHCRGPGPMNCEVCHFGYHFIPGEGCVEHLDDYKYKVKMPSEPNDTESRASNSDDDKTSGVSVDKDEEELQMESSIEDSNMNNVPHSEL